MSREVRVVYTAGRSVPGTDYYHHNPRVFNNKFTLEEGGLANRLISSYMRGGGYPTLQYFEHV